MCGGGRKNKFLIDQIKLNSNKNYIFVNSDEFNIDGDFVESRAFAYLAVRSVQTLPISFPNTTGCSSPCSGGEIVEF